MSSKIIHLGQGSHEPPPVPNQIRFYSMRFCPYSHRVHLVLEAKGIPHDVVFINLKQKPEWYLNKFPAGKVPAVLVKGEFITESLVITDFLDDYSPNHNLRSSDPIQKAKDRLLIDAFGQVISNLYKCFTSPSLNESLLQPAFDSLDNFEKELSSRGTPFFFGDRPGMVDYAIWPWCERIQMLKVLGGDNFVVPKERFPKMITWSLAMLEDPVVQTWAISPDNHAKFIKLHLSGSSDYDSVL